jgi:hypothetical protein
MILLLVTNSLTFIKSDIKSLNIETDHTHFLKNDPWINVISPNGDELWSKFQSIIWDWGGELPILPVYFNILYKKINESWEIIIHDYKTEYNTYFWNTQNVENGQYLIKVELWLDTDIDGHGDTLYLNDSSDDWFTINNYDTSDDVPPKVWITRPQRALYINDNEIIPFFIPIIIGDIQIWPHAYDNESGILRLELYINDELKDIFLSIPKSWIWNEICLGKYTIKLVAFDKANNSNSCVSNVLKFF